MVTCIMSMQAKGIAVASIPLFVEAQFGSTGKEQWFNALSDQAQEVYREPILSSKWYPMQEIIVEPTQAICDLFYQGNLRGAWEAGRFSAEKGLKGILRLMVKAGSPKFLLDRGGSILQRYYQPSEIVVEWINPTHAIFKIVTFGTPNELIEHRIAGWTEAAIPITGAKNGIAKIESSLAKGDKSTDIHLLWTNG